MDLQYFSEEDSVYEDYIFYDIAYEDISVPFKFLAIDTSKYCGPRSALQFVEFIWNNMALINFKMYSTVAMAFDTPRIVHFKHYRAASDGWKNVM